MEILILKTLPRVHRAQGRRFIVSRRHLPLLTQEIDHMLCALVNLPGPKKNNAFSEPDQQIRRGAGFSRDPLMAEKIFALEAFFAPK